MAEQKLGPIDLNCDAPPYAIVKASRLIGVNNPEDVPWYRMSHFLGGQFHRGLFGTGTWQAPLTTTAPPAVTCACKQKLPRMEEYIFAFLSGIEDRYYVGQCTKCHAVFWDEP